MKSSCNPAQLVVAIAFRPAPTSVWGASNSSVFESFLPQRIWLTALMGAIADPPSDRPRMATAVVVVAAAKVPVLMVSLSQVPMSVLIVTVACMQHNDRTVAAEGSERARGTPYFHAELTCSFQMEAYLWQSLHACFGNLNDRTFFAGSGSGVWHFLQSTCACCPSKGNAVFEWSNLLGYQSPVTWHRVQSVTPATANSSPCTLS